MWPRIELCAYTHKISEHTVLWIITLESLVSSYSTYKSLNQPCIHSSLCDPAGLTWGGDVALGTSDWLPGSAQGHQCSSLRWVFLYFLVSWWHRPCTSWSSFLIVSHLLHSFTSPTYDSVLQQHCGTDGPSGFCGNQAARIWPIRRGVILAVWRVGVSLNGSVSSSLSAAWTLKVVLCRDGDVYHFWGKNRRVKDLGETTERAEGGAGGQGRGRGVGVWTLMGWCWASVGHWRRKFQIRTNSNILVWVFYIMKLQYLSTTHTVNKLCHRVLHFLILHSGLCLDQNLPALESC